MFKKTSKYTANVPSMSLETLCCRSSVEGQSSEPSGPTFSPARMRGRGER